MSKYQLPKWPALVVHGLPVTREQAAVILVRTDSAIDDPLYATNDQVWNRTIANAAGWSDLDRRDSGSCDAAQERARERFGILTLEYLHNHRIGSSYIGGPHGWCSWGGDIGCRSYNIGKWPTADEVLGEWQRIAEAFPFLDLTCQLFSGEQCDENTKPVVEYRVAGGTVEMRAPVSQLGQPSDANMDADIRRLFSPGGERGCTDATLRWALALTEASLVPA